MIIPIDKKTLDKDLVFQMNNFVKVCLDLGQLPSAGGSASFFATMDKLLAEAKGAADYGHPFALADELLAEMPDNDGMFRCMAQSMLRQADTMEPLQLFSRSAASFGHDWSMAKLRRVLTAKLEQSDTSVEIRQLCVRLLLKIGLACGNAEDLLLAATAKHPTDLTSYLEYFCKQDQEDSDPQELITAKRTVLDKIKSIAGGQGERAQGEEVDHSARQSLIHNLLTGADPKPGYVKQESNVIDDFDPVDPLENFAELAQIIILGEMAR